MTQIEGIGADQRMPVQTSIEVHGGPNAYTLIVEPWAEEHTINPDDRCKVVVLHPQCSETLTVQWHDNALILFVELGDETYEFWRNGVMEFRTPVPVPGPLGELARYINSRSSRVI